MLDLIPLGAAHVFLLDVQTVPPAACMAPRPILVPFDAFPFGGSSGIEVGITIAGPGGVPTNGLLAGGVVIGAAPLASSFSGDAKGVSSVLRMVRRRDAAGRMNGAGGSRIPNRARIARSDAVTRNRFRVANRSPRGRRRHSTMAAATWALRSSRAWSMCKSVVR